ncbi:arabinogalactan oligomer / maltooligosaccharide transport system substrate-binding protein [Halolactibacillus halophilus]|uniref:Maltodextrin-binding protein n=1 Tax=Halolactibacillus halophilus TaxID=306540 RepID=A0A1I5MFF1_9BACI|nr:extracellular solute-binding protein [Halolactibacillus halophilus]GEM02205.1 maltose ABC transporter substrate-binding protein [Halolactibacillus halophilus]SFP08314.1 arabinogalactan oligomer / maltooligosaccharide transport system substrate-binding protein [Halolactibacillus halophilus]
MLKGKSFWLTALLMLVLSMFLVACGGDDEATDDGGTDTDSEQTDTEGEDAGDDSSSDLPEKPESLKVWVNDEEQQLNAYDEIFARFTDEHGIEIEVTPYSMLDQTEGLSLDGPSGQGPDLFFQPHDRMGDIHLQGLAAELEFTEEQQAKLEGYNQEALNAFNYEGIQYGIPAVVETYALFYNKSLVPEAPQTMDELMTIARDLTDDSGSQYGFIMEALNLYFVYPFLTSEGGYIFGQNDDGGYDASDIGLNNEGAVAGAETIQSWFDEGLIPQGADADVINGLFMDGSVGMVVNGPWAIPDYEAALGDDLGIATLPEVDGEVLNSFSGNKGWLVSYYTENQYWATELALFATNADSSETYYNVAGELPGHTAVEIEDEFMSAIFDQTQYAHPMPNIPEMSKVWEPVGDALTFISQGEDPQEVLDEAVELIKEDIALMEQ